MANSFDASGPRVALPGSERAAPQGAAPVGPADPNARTTVTVVVRSRGDIAAAAAALAPVAPASRTYLSREAFTQKYGGDPADIAAVEAFATSAGLTVVSADAARRSIELAGTHRELGAAFGAQLTLYTKDGATFCGRTGALTIPASLAGIILGVFGLDKRPQARAQFRRNVRAAAATTSFTPPQVAAAYDFPAGTTGVGQTVGLIELGGGYATADLTAYFAQLNVPMPKVVTVSVDGAANAPTGDPNGADAEVMLDIEVVGSIAPGATIVVYFAPNTDQGFLDAITTAVHDTANHPNIVSISWGGPEADWTGQATTNFDAAFAAAATLGVTVTAAAGDNGSSDGLSDGLAHVDFPSSSPNVLACGGTTLHASGAKITSETVWNDGSSGGATGGGVSDVFPLPSWQAKAGVPPSANAGGHVGRGVPDVAGDADPETGYSTRVDGQAGVIGGTSAVAPLWAALLARINAQLGKPVGFVNAHLYAASAPPFHDIVSGNNGAYAAKAGWDACTGLGTPDGAHVANALQAASSTGT
jgi:kumamolisin